jgi:hypothetical protein
VIVTANLIDGLVRAASRKDVVESPSPQSIHRLLFREWLSLTFEEQKAELDAYVLTGPYEPMRAVNWLAEHYTG